MTWDVEYTDEFASWWNTLSEGGRDSIRSVVEVLEEDGPGLGRPLVDAIHRSRHANMKEIRVTSENIRILFAFDPRRTAILLIGGNKTNRWRAWYTRMIPVADQLYDEYLDELRREGTL